MRQAMDHEFLRPAKPRVDYVLEVATKQTQQKMFTAGRKRVNLVRTPSTELTTYHAPPQPSAATMTQSPIPATTMFHVPNATELWNATQSTLNSPEENPLALTEVVSAEFWESSPSARSALKAIRSSVGQAERILFQSSQTVISALEVVTDMKSELHNARAPKEYFETMLTMLKEWATELQTNALETKRGFTHVLEQLHVQETSGDLASHLAKLSIHRAPAAPSLPQEDIKNTSFKHLARLEVYLHMQESFWARVEAALNVLQQRAKIIEATLRFNPGVRSLVNKLEDYFALWQEGATLLCSQQTASTTPLRQMLLLPNTNFKVENETSPPPSWNQVVDETTPSPPPPSAAAMPPPNTAVVNEVHSSQSSSKSSSPEEAGSPWGPMESYIHDI